MSETRPIVTTRAALELGVLSAEDVRRIHLAALHLLDERAAAAEAALAQSPSTVTLAGRVPAHDVALDGAHCWLAGGAVDAAPTAVRPLEGGDPGPATSADLEAFCMLADALPEVALIAGPPVRVDGVGVMEGLAHVLSLTSKHVLAVGLRTAAEGETAARLARAVAPQDSARRPLSLCAGPNGREAALAAAASGLAVTLVLPPAASTARSVDLGAALVRHHAGVLAGCAAVQEAAPGARFLYVAVPAQAGLPVAGPQAVQFQIAAAQLARHAGLPAVLGGMTTSSHEPDWGACTQNAFAALSGTAARAAVTAGAGTLGAGAVMSAQQLVMDSEIFSWTATIARGVEVDEETVALDVIEHVGIGGNYLGQRHTRRHMRDVWRPRLLDRSMWDAWEASGREGAYERASRLAEQLLTEHQPLPLPDEVRGTLARIAAEAGL